MPKHWAAAERGVEREPAEGKMSQDEANAKLADADMMIDKMINFAKPARCPGPDTANVLANGDSPNIVDGTSTTSA